MATQEHPAIQHRRTEDPVDTPPVEPTFFFSGQAYVFTEGELKKAGPEFAEQALRDTYRHAWTLFGEWRAGRLSDDAFRHQMTELTLGAWALRDLIPHHPGIVPNGHLVRVH